MEDEVRAHLDELRRRLAAIRDNPMTIVKKSSYSVLSKIAVLLVDRDQLLKSLAESPSHTKAKELVESIISECVSACTVVDEFVCNESPEGYLPERAQLLKLSPSAQDAISKILLLNGWKTVKDSLDIISHLVTTCSPAHHLRKEDKEGLVDCTIARKMIVFLHEYQLRLVHRGAFEQCARAFSRLVDGLWGAGCPQCCDTISNILQQIQYDLTKRNADQAQFHLTRRGAGLPYILQSILSAEQWAPGSGSVKKSKKRPINELAKGGELIGSLVNLLQPINKPYDWQVITTMNILKALVTDSRLENVVKGWLEDMFRLCIDGWYDQRTYSSSLANFDVANPDSMAIPIQNITATLFKALMVRVFGVMRNHRDEPMSFHNQMSRRLFFTTYPTLFSIILKQLEELDPKNSSLLPILDILERLRMTLDREEQADERKRFLDFDFDRMMLALETLPARCRSVQRISDKAIKVLVQLLPLASHVDKFQHLFTLLTNYDQPVRNLRNAQLLRSTVQLTTQLVKQCTSNFVYHNVETKATIRKVLLEVYCQLDVFLADERRGFTGQTLHQMYLLHARIYKLATWHKWTEYHERTLGNDLFVRMKELDGQFLQGRRQAMLIGEEHFTVALMMDTLVHILPLKTSPDKHSFGDQIGHLAALQSEQTLNCRLLFWLFLNELTLYMYREFLQKKQEEQITKEEKTAEAHYKFRLELEHSANDTIFNRELDELKDTVDKLAIKEIDTDVIGQFLTSGHLFTLIGRSKEWALLMEMVAPRANHDSITQVEWNIFHEILRLLFNLRNLNLISNMPEFFKRMKRSFPTLPHVNVRLLKQIFEGTKLSNKLEPGHLSMTALLQVCLNDELDELLEKAEGGSGISAKNFDVHLMVAKTLHRLSRDVCINAVGAREVAISLLDISLPKWTKIVKPTAAKEPGVGDLLPNLHLPQILCLLFSTLFKLCQDWYFFVELQAVTLIKWLAALYYPSFRKWYDTDADDAAYSYKETRLAVKFFVTCHYQFSSRVARFAAIKMMVDLFLEQVAKVVIREPIDMPVSPEEGGEDEEENKKNNSEELTNYTMLLKLLLVELTFLKEKEMPTVSNATTREGGGSVEQLLLDTFRETIHEELLADLIKDIRKIEKIDKERCSIYNNRFNGFIEDVKDALI